MKTIHILEERFLKRHKQALEYVDLYGQTKSENYCNKMMYYINLKIEIVEILCELRNTDYGSEMRRLNKKYHL